jgi:hypothetical protein
MSLNDLILQVAGGRGELIEETIHSNIREYADKVKIYEEEAYLEPKHQQNGKSQTRIDKVVVREETSQVLPWFFAQGQCR